MSFFKNTARLIRRGRIRCSVVVAAAGSSSRFGGDKIFAPISGVPVLAHSLLTLENCEYISDIVVVTAPSKITEVAELCEKYNIGKVEKIIIGGDTRLESAALGVFETNPKSSLIAIHDGARPLVTSRVIEDVIELASLNRAAVPAVQVKDTIKVVREGRVIDRSPDRPLLYCIQTPQVFKPEIIKGALTNAVEKGLTVYDDASAVEALGIPVYISRGCEENIKITTQSDILFAESILSTRKGGDSPCE